MSWGTTRAKSGRLLVKKTDKSGREYVGQNEVIPSFGLHSAKEMEQQLQLAADESQDEVVATELKTYNSRETPPVESDPLRGSTRSHTQWGGFRGTASWPPESTRTANSPSQVDELVSESDR